MSSVIGSTVNGDSVQLIANIDLSHLADAPDTLLEDEVAEPVWISIISVGDSTIHLPLVYTDTRPTSGVIAEVEGAWLVDGVCSPRFLAAWIRGAREDGTLSPLAPAQVDTVEAALLARVEQARLLTGEQSNSSVFLDAEPDDAVPGCVVKFLRILHPGTHPELEVPRALAELGWLHVAAPMAWMQRAIPVHAGGEMQSTTLAIAASIISNAVDGFEYFVDLASRGDDPQTMARLLGRTTAELHEKLAAAMGTFDSVMPSQLSERVRVNLHAAAAEVPELRDSALMPALEEVVARAEDLDQLPPLIRIHGDYHLGQTLLGRGDDGEERWFILDFEGEPLRPLEARREPDFALRDVAGMLRSFDYAAAKGEAGSDWLELARAAFVDGYTGGSGFGQVEGQLVRILELEKTAYEAVYEFRMRPDWLNIPLNALRRLCGSA